MECHVFGIVLPMVTEKLAWFCKNDKSVCLKPRGLSEKLNKLMTQKQTKLQFSKYFP